MGIPKISEQMTLDEKIDALNSFVQRLNLPKTMRVLWVDTEIEMEDGANLFKEVDFKNFELVVLPKQYYKSFDLALINKEETE